MSLDGIHDVCLTESNINGERFATMVRSCLYPHSIVILDNASIHHVEEVSAIIEEQAGAQILFQPSVSSCQEYCLPLHLAWSQNITLLMQVTVTCSTLANTMTCIKYNIMHHVLSVLKF